MNADRRAEDAALEAERAAHAAGAGPDRTPRNEPDRAAVESGSAAHAAGQLADQAAAVRDRALSLGATLAADARRTVTLGGERALLRLLGVTGLTSNERPLAHEVVQRWAGSDRARLGEPLALPFAVAALEYDLEPQQVALEVAAGHIDLVLEAELLQQPHRRVEAEATLRTWLGAAFARFDANRTARHELSDLLGDPATPWVCTELDAFDATQAVASIPALVDDGADIVRVRVPRDAELPSGLGELAGESEWPSGHAAPAPAGSQRGLALLRQALDEAGAREERYVRLATRRLGLAAPEQAVVAGFERVDLVCSDAFEGVVQLGIDPSRALADEVLACAILARTGARLVLGPGPLLLAAELERGEPIQAATQSGRALALQALGVGFARAAGMPADLIVLGVPIPVDAARSDTGSWRLAEVALRSLVFPEYSLGVEQPEADLDDEAWPAVLAALAVGNTRLQTVLSRPAPGRFVEAAVGVRSAARVARWLTEGRPPGDLGGAALVHARASLAVALETLEEVGRRGLDPLFGGASIGRTGADGMALRRGDPDLYDLVKL